MTDVILYMFAVYVGVSFAALYMIVRHHEKERKDLLNRIMARDYHEYTISQIPSAPTEKKNPFYDSVVRAERRARQEEENEG